jgi:hypothetical protein
VTSRGLGKESRRVTLWVADLSPFRIGYAAAAQGERDRERLLDAALSEYITEEA